jgi:hypothetical protein
MVVLSIWAACFEALFGSSKLVHISDSIGLGILNTYLRPNTILYYLLYLVTISLIKDPSIILILEVHICVKGYQYLSIEMTNND